MLAEKEKFKIGFTKYLQETENATEELANDIVEKIWRIIEDSQNYLFCAAHAFAYQCDQVYGAYLKAYYPFEFYSTALEIYTEKGNKEKVSAIIKEMKDFFKINLTVGKFGEDNRNWYCDKENRTISQNLASIKFISKQAAEDLYIIGKENFDTFTDLLRKLQMETSLTTRQIEILINLGYFSQFGKTQKLLNIYNEFFNGKNKLTKTIKSYEKRMLILKEYENSIEDVEIPIKQRLTSENEFAGMCLQTIKATYPIYFVTNIDDKYGIKIECYNSITGKIGILKIKKQIFEQNKLQINDCFYIQKFSQYPKYEYKNGIKTASKTEKEFWLQQYKII